MRLRNAALCLSLTSALGCPLPAQATLGIFEHGNGIKAMGLGGVGYTAAEETVAIAANPSHALQFGRRYDLGVDGFNPRSFGRYRGNAAGPDMSYRNEGREYFFIPQGGFSRPLSERWAWGISALSAGLGPDYDEPTSPYERFGAASRTSLFLSQISFVTALAYQLTPSQRVGISVNPSYQTVAFEGFEPFVALSQSPTHVTNQGKDSRLGIGYSLGWHGQFGPLSVGAAYRSKTWTGRHKEYEGLLAESGRLEIPAYWGGALAYTPVPAWTLAFEYQRYEFASEKAFGNSVAQLAAGNPLGADNGAGFGYEDQNVYKFGLAWQATPALRLRVGTILASQIVQPGDTLFDVMGPVTSTTQYSAGFSYLWKDWDISAYAFDSPRKTIRGDNSIPPAFGGGEVDASYAASGLGLSFGRRF